MALALRIKTTLLIALLFSGSAYAVHCLENLHEVGASELTVTVRELRVDMADVLAVDMTANTYKPKHVFAGNASYYYFPREGETLEIIGLKGKRIYFRPGLMSDLKGKKPDERLKALVAETGFGSDNISQMSRTEGKYLFVNPHNDEKPRMIQLSDNATFEASFPISEGASVFATLRENNPIGFRRGKTTYSIDLYAIQSEGYSVNTIQVTGFSNRPHVKFVSHPILGAILQVGDRNFRVVMEVSSPESLRLITGQ